MTEDSEELETISGLTAGLETSMNIAEEYVAKLDGMLETARENHEAELSRL